MYTYRLGNILISDELYHDDLEAMTFGRKDQNELYHHGIKGQSWGKRRFQNEDGSLTAAGRNRYDVGDPKQGVTAYSDTGGRGGSGVNYYRTSGTGRPSTSQPAARVASKPQSRGTGVQSVNKNVVARANSGKKAADSLFGRIGNLATNAAKDVGKVATNAYNGASRAVNNAADWVGDRAQDVGNAVTNAAQDVKDWYTGDKSAREAQRYDNVVQNFEQNGERNINEGTNTISRGINAPDSAYDIETGEKWGHKLIDEGVKQRELGYDQHDIAREYGRKADEAQGRYENAPRQLLERAGNWVGDRANDAKDWIGDRANDAKDWIGDRANDVGNAVGGAYDSVKDTVTDAAQGVKNWYTGEGDKRSADWYRDLSTRDTDWLGTGRNLIENHQAVANESRAMADALRKSGDYEGAKKYEQNAKAYQRAVDQMTSDRNRNLSNAEMYDERYNNAPRQVLSNLPGNISNAANAAGNAIGNAAKDVGDWASNAAADVRDWGAGALDKGRQAFENLFGKSETPNAELSDPNPKTFTENIIREQIIPEQRITENRIEEQRLPEAIIREGDEYRQMTPDQRQARMDSQKNRPTVSGSNNVQTWDNGNINTWDNVKTFGDPDMVNTIKMLNDNGFFNRGSSSNSGNTSSMADKPDGVSDEYWRNYTFNGGTRESYDHEKQNQKIENAQREQRLKELLSDKPNDVSNEYWEAYKSNGGTRDSYEREMNARKNSYNNHSGQSLNNPMDYNAEQERLRNISAQQDKNGYRVSEVDTSRPYHFTLDPVSGQTVVVYDDEKRR